MKINTMKATITVHQNGKQLLGSDYTKVVDSPTPKKIKTAERELNSHLQRLVNKQPFLSKGWVLKIEQ